jgi:hypothetical protein
MSSNPKQCRPTRIEIDTIYPTRCCPIRLEIDTIHPNRCCSTYIDAVELVWPLSNLSGCHPPHLAVVESPLPSLNPSRCGVASSLGYTFLRLEVPVVSLIQFRVDRHIGDVLDRLSCCSRCGRSVQSTFVRLKTLGVACFTFLWLNTSAAGLRTLYGRHWTECS